MPISDLGVLGPAMKIALQPLKWIAQTVGRIGIAESANRQVGDRDGEGDQPCRWAGDSRGHMLRSLHRPQQTDKVIRNDDPRATSLHMRASFVIVEEGRTSWFGRSWQLDCYCMLAGARL